MIGGIKWKIHFYSNEIIIHRWYRVNKNIIYSFLVSSNCHAINNKYIQIFDPLLYLRKRIFVNFLILLDFQAAKGNYFTSYPQILLFLFLFYNNKPDRQPYPSCHALIEDDIRALKIYVKLSAAPYFTLQSLNILYSTTCW